MILAPNLRQLLSGSRLIFGILVMAGLMVGCSTSKRGSSTNSKPRTTTTDSDRTNTDDPAKVDTVIWKEAAEKDFPPINNVDEEAGAEIIKEDVYDIALLLPFEAESYNQRPEEEINETSERFIQFYAGLLLAIDQLEEEGLSMRLNVHDIGSGESLRRDLHSLIDEDTDLIIGPYSRDNLKTVSALGRKKQVPVVSPWQSSSRITKDNPFYIQLRPALTDHYYRIMEHIAQHFDHEQVILLGRDNRSDRSRLDYCQRVAGVLYDGDVTVKEYYIDETALGEEEMVFDSTFFEGTPPVFVLPNWSYRDEHFIYSCLRKLGVEKGLNEVYVYGMPIMLESDKIDFENYRSLNMRICRSGFTDEASREIRSFRRTYYDKFGGLPGEDAYQGHDVMLYLGRNIGRYGKNFQYFLDRDTTDYLSTSFEVLKVHPKDFRDQDKLDEINYFQNKKLEILEFVNNRFRRSE